MRALLSQYGEMARAMLAHMFWDDGPNRGLYCFKIQPDGATEAGDPARTRKSGTSIRYSLIAWIGQFHCGLVTAGSPAFARWKTAGERLEQDLRSRPASFTIGDLGLALWLGAVSGEQQAPWYQAAQRLLIERLSKDVGNADTADLGSLLAGLSHAGDHASARIVIEALLSCYNPATRLFAFNSFRSGSSLLPSRQRYRHGLGSFASQVYPLVGLSTYVKLTGGDRAVRGLIAEAATNVAELQGDNGEWWWIYDVRTGEVVQHFPVYSIHQDGMGPMALLAVMQALGTTNLFSAVERSLRQLQVFRDSSGKSMLEGECIWRAGNRSIAGPDPADLPFGITPEEMKNVTSRVRPAWLRSGTPTAAGPERTYVLREARPYCPGWILFAQHLAEQFPPVSGQ